MARHVHRCGQLGIWAPYSKDALLSTEKAWHPDNSRLHLSSHKKVSIAGTISGGWTNAHRQQVQLLSGVSSWTVLRVWPSRYWVGLYILFLVQAFARLTCLAPGTLSSCQCSSQRRRWMAGQTCDLMCESSGHHRTKSPWMQFFIASTTLLTGRSNKAIECVYFHGLLRRMEAISPWPFCLLAVDSFEEYICSITWPTLPRYYSNLLRSHGFVWSDS